MNNHTSYTFKIAQKRNLKLHKRFVEGWITSKLPPKGHRSLSDIQRAFSSIHTSDETRNAVINAVFNPTFSYSTKLGIPGLELRIGEKSGQPYLQWYDGKGKKISFDTPLQKQILRSSQVLYPFNHMMKSISKLTTPLQTSKALNAGVWFGGYLHLIGDLALLTRQFLAHSDIDKIFWYESPSSKDSDEFHLKYLSHELSQGFYDPLDNQHPSFTVVEGNQHFFTTILPSHLKDLQAYDDFINSLGSEGISSEHQKFKDNLTKLITLSESGEWKSMSDTTMINDYRMQQFQEGVISNQITKPHYNYYIYYYSIISTLDIAWGMGDMLGKVDITDPDVMDKLMRIHGNKMPPRPTREWIFNEENVVIEAHGAKVYYNERERWINQYRHNQKYGKQRLYPMWIHKDLEDTS